MVRLTDRPDMTLDVYRGRKTTKQNKQNQQRKVNIKLQVWWAKKKKKKKIMGPNIHK